jgi:hypothetical protein
MNYARFSRYQYLPAYQLLASLFGNEIQTYEVDYNNHSGCKHTKH